MKWKQTKIETVTTQSPYGLVLRVGDYKLISGYPGHDSGWYPPDKEHQTYTDSEEWYNRFNVEGSDYMERIKADNVSQYKLFNLKGTSYERRAAKYLPPVIYNQTEL